MKHHLSTLKFLRFLGLFTTTLLLIGLWIRGINGTELRQRESSPQNVQNVPQCVAISPKIRLRSCGVKGNLTGKPVVSVGRSQPTLSVSPSTPPSIVPPLAVHPLPPSLADWQDLTQSGDYFAELQELQTLPVGALVWSEFPVTVSIDPSAPSTWQTSVEAAVRAWGVYLPLVIVAADQALTATDWDDRAVRVDPLPDITIVRTAIVARRQSNNLRAASARTTYEFWVETDQQTDQQTNQLVKQDPTAISSTTPSTEGRSRLAHRFLIQVNPTQTGNFVESAVRHEMGHALGIWGHSHNPDDVMYRSQIANPPPISPRDVNTLQRIYEQPTRLGWWF